MSVRRPIIGVMGSRIAGTPALAYFVGQEVRNYEAVLLTGGQPDHTGIGATTVKTAAMNGAIDTRNDNRPARVVGIIPEEYPTHSKPDYFCECHTDLRSLYVHTKMSSYERNVINGTTPDVVIALKGEKGTLSEVAFACFAGIPVVFLDCLPDLRAIPTAPGSAFDTVLTTAQVQYPAINGRPFDRLAITRALVTTLTTATLGINAVIGTGVNVTDANTAVRLALSLISPSGVPSTRGRFPGIPFDPLSIPTFEHLLQAISE